MRKYVFDPKYRCQRQILNFLSSNKTSCVSFIQIVVKSNYLEYAMAYETQILYFSRTYSISKSSGLVHQLIIFTFQIFNIIFVVL